MDDQLVTVPISFMFNEYECKGKATLTPEIIKLLETGFYKIEPVLIKIGGVWQLGVLSIVKRTIEEIDEVNRRMGLNS